MFRKIPTKIKCFFCKKNCEKVQAKMYLIYFTLFGLIGALSSKAFADSPWGGGSSVDPDTVQSTITSDTTSALKTGTIVVGSFLLLVCVGTLYKVLSRSADEKKEHGNSIMTLLVAGLCAVTGLILLALAWKGLTAKV